MKMNLTPVSVGHARKLLFAGVLVATLMPWTACADEVAPQAEPRLETEAEVFPDEWNMALRPYFFLSGLSGSVTIDPVTFPLNSKFSDILGNVKLGGFITFTAEKGQWGFGADFQYINLFAQNSGLVDIGYDLKNIIGEADVYFRPELAPTLRFLAGVRAYSLTQTVLLDNVDIPSVSTTVVDPVIGAYGSWNLTDDWDFELRGDIGGLGVSSEFTYQLMALFHWEISHSLAIPFGYRILGYQIKKDSVLMDTKMAGLVLGLDIQF